MFECDIEVPPGGRAGLILFYDESSIAASVSIASALSPPVRLRAWPLRQSAREPHALRVTNRRHTATFDTSGDGGLSWRRFDRGTEVSSYHHNVRGGFLMLRPGLYAASPGEAIFRDFRFIALWPLRLPGAG